MRQSKSVDFLQGHNESLRVSNDQLFKLLESERERTAQLVGTLASAIEELKHSQEELRKLREATPVPTQMVANAPLYMSEQEEDLQWQLDNGLITKEELQDVLKAAGIENTEIEFS
jgi:hypothetical protein